MDNRSDWITPNQIEGRPALLFAAVSVFPDGTFRVMWRSRDLETEVEVNKPAGISPGSGLALMRDAVTALYLSTIEKMHNMEIPIPQPKKP